MLCNPGTSAAFSPPPAVQARSAVPARTAGVAAITAATLLGTGCGIFRGQESPSAYVDDSTLTARVRTALIKAPDVKASEIDVHTYHGVVTLNGVVDSNRMVERAEEVVRETPGVRSVRSAMQVASAGGAAEER